MPSVKQPNPSQLKYQKKKWKRNRQLHRVTRLNQEREDLIRKHQLPSDVTIIRRRKNSHDRAKWPKLYTYGCVAIVDEDTGDLIVSARFVDLPTSPPDQVAQYKLALSTLYHHGRARYPITCNGAKKAMGRQQSGEMFPNGFRPGFESGLDAGRLRYFPQ